MRAKCKRAKGQRNFAGTQNHRTFVWNQSSNVQKRAFLHVGKIGLESSVRKCKRGSVFPPAVRNVSFIKIICIPFEIVSFWNLRKLPFCIFVPNLKMQFFHMNLFPSKDRRWEPPTIRKIQLSNQLFRWFHRQLSVMTSCFDRSIENHFHIENCSKGSSETKKSCNIKIFYYDGRISGSDVFQLFKYTNV